MGEISFLRLAGNLYSLLTHEEKDKIRAKLGPKIIPKRLLLDISEVKRLDSWGEDCLGDLIMSVVIAQGKVAVVLSKSNSLGFYVFFRHYFRDDPKSYSVFLSVDEAETWLGIED